MSADTELEFGPGEILRAHEELLSNPVYRLWKQAADQQVARRESEILNGELTRENMFDREMIRGERAGMVILLSIIDTFKEIAEQDLINQQQEQKNETQV